jgi:hypothetical protein
MLSFRWSIGLFVVSVVFVSAANGKCAEQNIDQQIVERTRQYQESLRQRAAQLSPSFQAKIESQTQQPIAKCMKKWNNGEISVRIALPRLAEARRMAQFVTRHLPGSDAPAGSLGFGTGMSAVVLTITAVQHVVKSFTTPIADVARVRSGVSVYHQSGNLLSYFIQIACTVVQRR